MTFNQKFLGCFSEEIKYFTYKKLQIIFQYEQTKRYGLLSYLPLLLNEQNKKIEYYFDKSIIKETDILKEKYNFFRYKYGWSSNTKIKYLEN